MINDAKIAMISADTDNHCTIEALDMNENALSRLGYYGSFWGVDRKRILLDESKNLGTSSLNDIMNSDIYYQSENAKALPERNYPIKQAGLLEVHFCTPDWIYQRYTPFGTGRIYKRTYHGSWLPWYEFIGNIV